MNNTQYYYPSDDNEVILLIYDISNGMANAMSFALTGQHHKAVYHTSVIVFKKEYFFGGGVQVCEPYQSGHTNPIEIRKLGTTDMPKEVFDEFIKYELDNKYNMNTYNIFTRNCNHFTHDAMEFLTGIQLDEEILQQANKFKTTPLGGMIENMFSNFDGDFTNINKNNNLINNSNNNSTNSNVIYLNTIEDFIDKVNSAPLSVLYFYGDYCPPCKTLAPLYDQWSNNYKNITFFKINTQINREVAAQFNIQSIPCLIFMKNSNEVKRIVGLNKQEIENYLKYFT